MNIAEFRRLAKPHKYGAKRVKLDGITFGSELEAGRYQQLKLLERAGAICELKVHPRYELRAYVPGGDVVIGEYEADFGYREMREPGIVGSLIVEDCKGVRLPLYLWKKKHFEAQYRVKIREITKRTSRS